MHKQKAEACLRQKQPPTAVQNMKAEAVFVSFHTPDHSLLQTSHRRLFVGQFVNCQYGQLGPVLLPSLHLEGRFGCITIGMLGLSLPTKVGCSYPQPLCQCPVWHLRFGFIRQCGTDWLDLQNDPGSFCKHVIWIIFLLYFSAKAACILITPGCICVWFILASLNN